VLEGESPSKIAAHVPAGLALLRHGDQTAERLQIDRERLAVPSRHAHLKWKRKIIIGLQTLKAYVEKYPEADAAMAMAELFRQGAIHSIRPNPTESD
jgi:hypothetical protein